MWTCRCKNKGCSSFFPCHVVSQISHVFQQMTRCLPQVVFGHIYHPNVIEGALAGGSWSWHIAMEFYPFLLVNICKYHEKWWDGPWLLFVDPGWYEKRQISSTVLNHWIDDWGFNAKSGTVAVFLGLMAGSLAAFTLGPVLISLFMSRIKNIHCIKFKIIKIRLLYSIHYICLYHLCQPR